MNIVVLDGYTENPGDLSWDGLSALGKLTVHDRTSLINEAEIQERLLGADAVYTNKTPLSGATLKKAASTLRFVGVLATGFNVVDVAAAGSWELQSATFRLTELRQWASLPLPCFWNYATM